jgi:hypothetical protein
VREHILREIRRLAAESGGRPPGLNAFVRQSGIARAKWYGVFWARWSDALAEAGFAPNAWQRRFDSSDVLLKVAELCRKLGRLPTEGEMRLCRTSDTTFPNTGTISGHFPTKTDLVEGLRKLAITDGYDDLLPMLPNKPQARERRQAAVKEGFVYLLKSGDHYKIGRSDELERRMREVRISLPETVTLVHAIRTDDPPGIEVYWHRRFNDRRANGEWFRLTGDDVRAFARRKFQ